MTDFSGEARLICSGAGWLAVFVTKVLSVGWAAAGMNSRRTFPDKFPIVFCPSTAKRPHDLALA